MSFYCNAAFCAAQHALLYIIPAMLAVTVLSARSWGLLAPLWDGELDRSGYSELAQTDALNTEWQSQGKDVLGEGP